jgi:hypothetical protein
MMVVLSSLVAISSGLALAADVYVLSSGNTDTDNALLDALVNRGHTPTLGPQWSTMDGTEDFRAFDVVYFQMNHNWAGTIVMDTDAQQNLIDFARRGGGVVFSEWVLWAVERNVSQFSIFADMLPAESRFGQYRDDPSPYEVEFTQATSDAIINSGLSSSFTVPSNYIDGIDSFVDPRAGASVFYETDYVIGSDTSAGLVGWDYFAGRVICFSTTNADDQLVDPNFEVLLGNTIEWASRAWIDGACPVDFAAPQEVLNFFDTSEFNSLYSSGDPQADINGDGVLNFFDVSAFTTRYNQGC